MDFPMGKMEFWTHWEFCAYTEYLALGKALLTTLYLKVKVYITNLLTKSIQFTKISYLK